MASQVSRGQLYRLKKPANWLRSADTNRWINFGLANIDSTYVLGLLESLVICWPGQGKMFLVVSLVKIQYSVVGRLCDQEVSRDYVNARYRSGP